MNNDISTAQSLALHRMNAEIPHYRDIEQGHRFQWLGTEIVKLNQILHRETVDDFLNTDVVALDETIMDDMYLSDLTFEEIDEAFSRGVCGSYGDYYGLNPPSMLGFLRSYMETPKKKEATKIARAQQEERRRADEDARIRKEVEARRLEAQSHA